MTEKVTRGAAIITVKRWVPDMQPMNDMVRNFALRLLRRLQKRPSQTATIEDRMDSSGDNDAMEDGEMPQEEVVQTEYLPEQLELPAQNAHVLQHVELVFALCVKCPEFLDEYVLLYHFMCQYPLILTGFVSRIFDVYGQMDDSVQEAIQELITALIRSLGPSHGRLLSLMRTFPPGAESLALRIITIFTENGRPSSSIVTLVKSLLSERELDARFLIPIIAEMDKVCLLMFINITRQ